MMWTSNWLKVLLFTNAFRIKYEVRADLDHLTTSHAQQYAPHTHTTRSPTRPMAPNYTAWKPHTSTWFTPINTGNWTSHRHFQGNTDRTDLEKKSHRNNTTPSNIKHIYHAGLLKLLKICATLTESPVFLITVNWWPWHLVYPLC